MKKLKQKVIKIELSEKIKAWLFVIALLLSLPAIVLILLVGLYLFN